MLAEVLCLDDWWVRREPLSLNACFSTLSFVLSKGLLTGIDKDGLLLSGRWQDLRRATRQRQRNVAVEEVRDVIVSMSAIGFAGRPAEFASLACIEIINQGYVSVSIAQRLGSAFVEANEAMHDARDKRVAALDRFLKTIDGNSNVRETSFAIGYLASRISPGSMAHFQILLPLVNVFPSALLWYGALAGLVRDSGLVLQEFGGVGRRLLVALLDETPLLSRPECDISDFELLQLISGDKPLEDFVRQSASTVSVEFAPGVWTTIGWPPSRGRSEIRPDEERPLDTSQNRLIQERMQLARELAPALGELIKIYNSLAGPPGPTQQDLFPLKENPSPNPKRGRKRGE
jgi:hypothetical protein